MRIAFFDTILETHVPDSLERALRARGHEVRTTGRVWQGYAFPKAAEDLGRLADAVDEVTGWKPDVVLCFRPAALPPELLERMRRAGPQLMAWLSDDPVFWAGSYRYVPLGYDRVLHCGGAPLLEFYERTYGRPTGVNVPFWTDGEAFPYSYDPDRATYDVLFLGNVDRGVRAGRYDLLAALGMDVRVYGRVGEDPAGLGHGYLDSDTEVRRAAARARIALNIPQFFRDYAGSGHDFGGLAELGQFQYPSRLVQYAALGLPIVTVADRAVPGDFPELVTSTADPSDLQRTAAGLLADRAGLRDRSAATYDRFRRHFSAASRALLIEHLAVDDGWRGLDVTERATYFARFDGSAGEPDRSAAGPSPVQAAPAPRSPLRRIFGGRAEPGRGPDPVRIIDLTQPTPPGPAPGLRVSIVGTGWKRTTSSASVAERALTRLGCAVRRVGNTELAESSRDGYRWALSAAVLATPVELLVVCGTGFDLPESFVQALRDRGVLLLLHGLTGTAPDERNGAVARADLATCLEAPLAGRLTQLTGIPAVHVPPLVDAAYLRRVTDAAGAGLDPRMCLAADSASALQRAPDLGAVIAGRKTIRWAPDLATPAGDPLDALVRGLAHEVTVVLSPGKLATVAGREVLPFCLASGALVCVPRGTASQLDGLAGTAVVGFGSEGELAVKLTELRTEESVVEAYRAAGVAAAVERFGAEQHFRSLLGALVPAGAGSERP